MNGRWSLEIPDQPQLRGEMRFDSSERIMSGDLYTNTDHSAWWQSTLPSGLFQGTIIPLQGRAYGRRDLIGNLQIEEISSSTIRGLISDNVFFSNAKFQLRKISESIREFTIEVSRLTGQPEISSFNGFSLESIYAAAGIRCHVATNAEILNEPAAVSDADLDRILVNCMNRSGRDAPWYGHLLICGQSLSNPNSYGVMFDYGGSDANRFPRQGCAVFAETIQRRTQGAFAAEFLRTAAHEIGHMLNLVHPCDEGMPDGNSLMNETSVIEAFGDYPRNISFDFLPTNQLHLCHHPEPSVAFGQRPYRSLQCHHGLSQRTGEGRLLSLLTRLRISIENPISSFGDPVYLTAELENLSETAVTIFGDLDPRRSEFDLEIEKPNGRSELVVTPFRHCGGMEIVIPPGKSLKRSMPLGFDNNGILFDQPGIYRIRGFYCDAAGDQRVSESSPIEVRILHPQGNQEHLVARLQASANARRFLALGGGSHLRNDVYDILENHLSPQIPALYDLVRFYDGLDATFAFLARPDDVELGNSAKRLLEPLSLNRGQSKVLRNHANSALRALHTSNH